MSMRIYLGLTAGVLAILAFVGFLYSGNANWSNVSNDLTNCLKQTMELQKEASQLKEELAKIKQIVELKTLSYAQPLQCPPCPQEIHHCPACPQQQLQCPPCETNIIKKPCWHNTPLYQPGFNCSSCDLTSPTQWPWGTPADICSYISLGGCCHYRHLLGFDFKFSPQFGWGDLMMLDFAYTGHPELVDIVEFGTYSGVTSLYLGLMSHIRKGHFTTFDISEKRHHFIQGAWLSNMEYVELNLLTVPIDPRIIPYVSKEKTLYFFDNGDKTSECNRFLEFVAKGNKNVLCTHDWDVEITLNSIQDTLTIHGFEPWAHKHAEMLGSHVRCFRKRNYH